MLGDPGTVLFVIGEFMPLFDGKLGETNDGRGDRISRGGNAHAILEGRTKGFRSGKVLSSLEEERIERSNGLPVQKEPFAGIDEFSEDPAQFEREFFLECANPPIVQPVTLR